MSDLLYRAVVQLVLMFESESWALPYEMMQVMEGFHVVLLSQITGKREKQQADKTCDTPEFEEVIRVSGTKSEAEYIGWC